MKSKAAALPRSARLNAARQFTGRFSRHVQGRWFEVRARANQLSIARLGLIVGRRAAARAVDRSVAKRLAREEFRRVRADFPGLDVVVRLKTLVERVERVAARNELHELLTRIIR